MVNKKSNPKIDPITEFTNAINTAFQEENERLKAKNQILSDHIEVLNKEIERINTENLDFFKEIQFVKREKDDCEKSKKDFAKCFKLEKNEIIRSHVIEKQSLIEQNEFLFKEVTKIDYVYVKQFNQLYWGDNYPALKVLFDFLQKMSALDIGWSYFCDNMCLENLEPINLKTTMLSKKELGYILSRIKGFFLTEINGSNSKYTTWIQRKILIDKLLIDKDFIKNYIRDYKGSKGMVSEHAQEIKLIIMKIADRHH